MKRSTKIISIVSSALIVCGILISAIGIAMGGSTVVYINPQRLSILTKNSASLSDNLYIEKSVRNLDIDIGYSELEIVDSGHNGNKIVIEYANLNEPPEYEIKNNTLIFKAQKYNYINFGFTPNNENQKITIAIPNNYSLDSISVNSSCGNITLDEISCKSLEIYSNAGNVTASDINAADYYKASLNLGNLEGENIVSDSFDLNMDMGNLNFYNITSQSFSVQANCGDINLAGRLNGKNNIKCDLGNCTLYLYKSIDLYSCNIDLDLGSYDLNGHPSKAFETNAHGSDSLDIDIDCGNLEISEYDGGTNVPPKSEIFK